MKFYISDRQTVGNLQQKFNLYFPKLRLEFFNCGCEMMVGYSRKNHIPSETAVSEIRQLHNDGCITLRTDMKVHELEQLLENKFDLHAQVFCRSGNIWMKADAYDDKTLSEQSKMSMPMLVG